MSYIDSYNHTHLGDVFGLPIYHPLEKLDEEGLEADKDTLVLGGGSGEHPIMKIESLAFCVFQYHWFDYHAIVPSIIKKEELDNDKYQLIGSILREWSDSLDDRLDGVHRFIYDNLHYYWPMEMVCRFSERINSEVTVKNLDIFDNNLKEKLEEVLSSTYTEEKFGIVMGGIIQRFAKHLLDPRDLEYIEKLNAIHWHGDSILASLRDLFKPAIDQWSCSGKIIYRNAEGKPTVKWGVSMLDEERILKEYDVVFND